MKRALLGLGGNLGDPAAAMSAALRALNDRGDSAVRGVSRLFRTPPWGPVAQPPFLNAVASLQTSLDPHALLFVCLALEREGKRERRVRWGPRTIDLDILDMDGVALAAPDLVLPHPRALERAFVLAPLLDLDPTARIGGIEAAGALAELDRAGIEPASPDGTWWRRAP